MLQGQRDEKKGKFYLHVNEGSGGRVIGKSNILSFTLDPLLVPLPAMDVNNVNCFGIQPIKRQYLSWNIVGI